MLLLVSHGGMAKGLYESFCMIFGEKEDIDYEILNEEEGIEEFRKRMSRRLETVGERQLVILTDIGGGSPTTVCLDLLAQKKMLMQAEIIAGMNLPLLISLSIERDLEDGSVLHDNIEQGIEQAKQGIKRIKIVEPKQEDEKEEL